MDEKPRLDRQSIIDDLTAVCNSLGLIDENDGTYMKDRDCKSCLRELLRYLNADSDDYVARVTLGSLNIIKSDLIPLIVQYCDFNEGDLDMFTTILRLCTNLTTPISILFEKKEPSIEPEFLRLQNKLSSGLVGYKEAFASDDEVWSTLNIHLRHNEDDEIAFERLVILIRNILHIPVESTPDLQTRIDSDAHDMCLYRMNKSGIMNTIIRIASESSKGMEYCFHITEIIYLMLRNQNPETVARWRSETNEGGSDADKKRLAELTARYKIRKQSDNLNALRFRNRSLFVVQNCRSTGENPLIVRELVRHRETIKFDAGKTELRKAKNRKPISSETSIDISNTNTKVSRVTYGLKVFCQQFVEKVYNNYMQQIKFNLIQKRALDDDESCYLWMVQFFTAFTRHTNSTIDNISETLSTSTLHFIQILITNNQDKLKMEKKKFQDISTRLHLALRAYREILLLIRSIDSDSPFVQTAKKIKKNIFTENEYSSLLSTLFQQYDEPKHSVLYLEDLIITNSIFLELLDSFNCELDQQEPEQSETPPKKRGKKFDYKTAGFIMRYCCPDVLKAHVAILKKFTRNSDSVNLAILKLFERIVYDCKSEGVLFQISLFKCLGEIVDYNSSLPGYDRFKNLAQQLFQSFGALANKKRYLYQDILFWTLGEGIIEPDDDKSLESQKEELENGEAEKAEAEGEPELPGEYPLSDLQAELGISDGEDPLPSQGADSLVDGKSQSVDQQIESDNVYPLADLQAELEVSDEDSLPSLHDELVSNSDIPLPSPKNNLELHEEKSSSSFVINPTVAEEPVDGMSDPLDSCSDKEISNG